MNNKTTSSTNTLATGSSLLKRYSSQSRTNNLRSKPVSPLILRKQKQISVIPTNILQRSNMQSQGSPSEMKSSRTIEKKLYLTSSSQNTDRPMQQSQLTARGASSQSPMIPYTAITHASRKQQNNITASVPRSTSFNTPKVRK